jgi:hypothetical protein
MTTVAAKEKQLESRLNRQILIRLTKEGELRQAQGKEGAGG